MKRKYLAIGAFLMAVVFICIAATFQNVWTTNPFPLNVLNTTNLGVFNTQTPLQETTNGVEIFGVLSVNFNGHYRYVSANNTYTNDGTQSFIYFMATDPDNPPNPGWILTNVSSTLYDDFLATTPALGNNTGFPSYPLQNGSLFYIRANGAVGVWSTTNGPLVTNYTVISPNQDSYLNFTNAISITGTNQVLIVGNGNSVQVDFATQAIVAGTFNSSIFGFNDGIIGGHDNINYGNGSVMDASGFCIIYPNNGEDFLGGVELSSFNNAQGVCGALWSEHVTNNCYTFAGMISCAFSTLASVGTEQNILMAAGLNSYADIANGFVVGEFDTNYSSGSLYSVGDRNFATNGIRIYNYGQNNSISNASDAFTFGFGLTNLNTGTGKIGTTNANITFSNNFISVNGSFNTGSITNTNNIQTANIVVASGIKYTLGSLVSGNVLTSDASGNASWASPTSAALGYGVVTTNAGAVTLTNGNGGTVVLATNLPAGDWDVEAVVSYSGSGVTMVPGTGNSANLSTNASYSTAELQTVFVLTPTITLGNDAFSVTLPSYRVSNSVPTIVMARTSLLFTAGTVTCSGKMTCRQVH